MKKYFWSTIIVFITWLFSIINNSGWGLLYDTPSKMFWIIAIWFLYTYKRKKTRNLFARNDYTLIFFTIISFIILPIVVEGNLEGLTYLFTIPFVYCFACRKVNDVFIKKSGLLLAILGIFLSYIYIKTQILSGWNDNAIAMLILYSFLYFSISLYGNINFKKMTTGLFISVLFLLILINNTDSRSSAMFIVLSVLFAYRPDLVYNFARKRNFLFWALNFPLLLASFVVFFPDFFIFEYLEKISEEYYNKSIFNGRDLLWTIAFERLIDSYFLGTMRFELNYHNSCVAALTVFGIVGYICWYKILYRVTDFIRIYIYDNIVLGCFCSFFLIFWHQAFELGFISECPNMLPYMILGIALGRIKMINKNAPIKCNSSSLQYR